jgi:probable rRNA maturation factor
VIVTVFNEQNDLPIDIESLKGLVKCLLSDVLSISTNEVVIHLVNQRKIKRLHKNHFGDPSLTDCMSFPIDSPTDEPIGEHILGELFICPYTALQYAKQKQEDPYLEISLYLVHCILHLIGYDDIDEEDQREIRKMEAFCLSELQKRSQLLIAPESSMR